MIAILETHDPVRLHYLKMMLEEAELHPFVLEPAYRSLPSRLMVPDDEADLARRAVEEAERGLG